MYLALATMKIDWVKLSEFYRKKLIEFNVILPLMEWEINGKNR